jgi:hypothetical protein
LKLAPSQLPRRYRFAALPSISLFPSVRLKLARSPHSLAATRAASPSMSLIPLLHSRMIKRSETSSHLVAILVSPRKCNKAVTILAYAIHGKRPAAADMPKNVYERYTISAFACCREFFWSAKHTDEYEIRRPLQVDRRFRPRTGNRISFLNFAPFRCLPAVAGGS